jgi:hypothetical protein
LSQTQKERWIGKNLPRGKPFPKGYPKGSNFVSRFHLISSAARRSQSGRTPAGRLARAPPLCEHPRGKARHGLLATALFGGLRTGGSLRLGLQARGLCRLTLGFCSRGALLFSLPGAAT